MAQQPLREDSPSPLGGEVPASSLQDLLANFDPDPTDASISEIPGPTNSELAAAAEDEVPPSASWRLCHTVLNPTSIWVCLLGELELFVHLESAMLLQGFGAEAKMVPSLPEAAQLARCSPGLSDDPPSIQHHKNTTSASTAVTQLPKTCHAKQQ